MNLARSFTHYLSVALLFLWGGVMLYFYASGRIINYLPPDGIFQPMVLIAGIGLLILGLFNLLTTNAAEQDCGHDHGHSHDHNGCCGHDHSHDHSADCGHDHSHDHVHSADCGHDHSHDHVHTADCGHDHSHDHVHTADCGHDHAKEEHTHAHGMLEESGWSGRFTAAAILAVPLTLAALNSPDQFSARVAENKGLYSPNYADTSRADEFSLKKLAQTGPSQNQPALPSVANLAQPAPTSPDTPPAPKPAPSITDLPPAKTTAQAGTDAPATVSGGSTGAPAPAQSFGSFTLADLEAQVPKSAAGNFILDVPEIYYTGGDIEVQKVLTGQSVETIAQILPEKVNNDDGHRLRIFRMLVQCCAADARPYSIPLDFGKKAPDFKEMSWVKVVGTITYKQEGGQTVPILEAKSIEETTAPDQSMIY
jgi:hypothetical protein